MTAELIEAPLKPRDAMAARVAYAVSGFVVTPANFEGARQAERADDCDISMDIRDIESAASAEIHVYTPWQKVDGVPVSLYIREKPEFAKPSNQTPTSKNSVLPGDFVTVNKLMRLDGGQVMGQLESRPGWIPVFDPMRDEDRQVLARRMPMERGLWSYKVNYSGPGLALRRDPSYSQDLKLSPEIVFAHGHRFVATHRVTGWDGVVYVRPLGYDAVKEKTL